MIIIADSGSTKVEWSLIENGKPVGTCHTMGLNPFFVTPEQVAEILGKEFTAPFSRVEKIFFYGAGCANKEKNDTMACALSAFFGTPAEDIEVASDVVAAARSLCQDKPGIACILGTGSNSCYYDGREVAANVSPLGFILGDEGSGAVLGRKFVGDVLKNQLSPEIKADFLRTYEIEPGDIIEAVYRQPFPNRYLAKFTRFIAKYIDEPRVRQMVKSSFGEFLTRNVMQYENARTLPVCFTGSIAYHFRDILAEAVRESGLTLGEISQAPMEGLIRYHSGK